MLNVRVLPIVFVEQCHGCLTTKEVRDIEIITDRGSHGSQVARFYSCPQCLQNVANKFSSIVLSEK